LQPACQPFAGELEAGAVVSMMRGRLRVRPLPVRRD
jgi:hypothetical protein